MSHSTIRYASVAPHSPITYYRSLCGIGRGYGARGKSGYGYRPTPFLCEVWYWARVWCYGMCGTGLQYGATERAITELGYGATRE
eukprot:328312-Rhodomonas_salina.1